jgi:hypothetical protein
MDVDAVSLARAKAVLRRAPKLPGITFRGIPVEAGVFDFDDLLAMLSMSLDIARGERRAHDATAGVFKAISQAKVPV